MALLHCLRRSVGSKYTGRLDDANDKSALTTAAVGAVMTAEEVMSLIRARDKSFYVYVLCRPDGRPFYVGKGSGDRLLHHVWATKSGRRGTRYSIIRGILNSGLQVIYRIDSFHQNESDAYDREGALIREIGRVDQGSGPLTNRSDGGKGPVNSVANTDLRRIRSEKALRQWSEEGKRTAISQWSEALWQDDAFRTRMIVLRSSQEYRAKQAAKASKSWDDPEYRRKVAAANAQRTSSPQGREAARRAARTLWDTPEHRAKALAAMAAPEHRAKRSANVSARWQRQRELQARCIEIMARSGVVTSLPRKCAPLAEWEKFERSLAEGLPA